MRFPVREFVAHADCPNCGVLGFFTFCEPPMSDEASYKREKDSCVRAWGGETVVAITTEYDYHFQTDKTTCDVVRVCSSCNAQWGEK